MTSKKHKPHALAVEDASTAGASPAERRQQLIQQIGRLLAQVWLQRLRENSRSLPTTETDANLSSPAQ